MTAPHRDRSGWWFSFRGFLREVVLIALAVAASAAMSYAMLVEQERFVHVGEPLTTDPNGPLKLVTIVTTPVLLNLLLLVPLVATWIVVVLLVLWGRKFLTIDGVEPASDALVLTGVMAVFFASLMPTYVLVAAHRPNPAVVAETARQRHAVQSWAHARYGLTLDDASAQKVVDSQQGMADGMIAGPPGQDVIVSPERASSGTPASVIFRYREGEWTVVEDPNAPRELPTQS